MRPTTSLPVALAVLATLAGCGTKTPLTLPPQPQPPAKAAVLPAATQALVMAAEHGNSGAEFRQ